MKTCRKILQKGTVCALLSVLLLFTACNGGGSQSGSQDGAESAANAKTSGQPAVEASEAGTGESAAISGTGERQGAAAAAGETASDAAAAAEGAASSAAEEKEAADKEAAADEEARAAKVQELAASMTTEEKISQMIIPSIRTWDGAGMTDLAAAPALAEALQRHQYGGIILFGANIVDNAQTAKLISDLQENNLLNPGASVHIPYFMPVDEEGGIVIRLNKATRMTGNMAIGATGEKAEENARITGHVLGEELRALGFNVDFAPVIDVNSNPANPVIGTRSFSDDPQMVADLGKAYAEGLAKNRIIATYKHYPGHGDTSVDSHIGTPSVEKTYEELQETELVPFAAAVQAGAEMIMTAHITYPLIDEEMTFGDGTTRGFYPATMSEKMITEILRTDLGYDGLVVTDALEMDSIDQAGLVPGAQGSVEYSANIAEKAINAGVDLLLMPLDLTGSFAADFYDEYIAALEDKVSDGSIPQERIDESSARILRLKLKYGILDGEEAGIGEEPDSPGISAVGSDEHHEKELEIARQAVTVVKNDSGLLPVSGEASGIVILGRLEDDNTAIRAVVEDLRAQGILSGDTAVTVDYYCDLSSGEPAAHYPEELRDAIREADYVIGITRTFGVEALYSGNPQYEVMRAVIEDTHAGGGKFILLSENLPYDAARYQDADAIVLAYMGSGLDTDPTSRGSGTGGRSAGNANIEAALETIFGANPPQGRLPVNIPVIEEQEDGTLIYGTDRLYERGTGLTY